MVKFGKEFSTFYQICLNHGVQLEVCDTLYKKTNIEKEEQVIDAKDEDFLVMWQILK
jgi:predicted peroxiredoxin